MRIILNSVLDPERKIRAIVALRNSTRVEGDPDATMTLLDAKQAIEDVLAGIPTEVAVVSLGPLRDVLDWRFPGLTLAMDFILDVLATSSPSEARRIMDLPSYAALIGSLSDGS